MAKPMNAEEISESAIARLVLSASGGQPIDYDDMGYARYDSNVSEGRLNAIVDAATIAHGRGYTLGEESEKELKALADFHPEPKKERPLSGKNGIRIPPMGRGPEPYRVWRGMVSDGCVMSPGVSADLDAIEEELEQILRRDRLWYAEEMRIGNITLEDAAENIERIRAQNHQELREAVELRQTRIGPPRNQPASFYEMLERAQPVWAELEGPVEGEAEGHPPIEPDAR